MTDTRESTESRDVAVRDNEPVGLDLPAQRILSVTGTNEVERVEQSVVLPPIYQYSIWRQGSNRVMLTSDAYDYINRVMGVQLYQPRYVNDEHGKQQLNPIHRPDYIYLRMIGIWRNDAGQMVSYQEDVEVDYKLTYQDARINAKSMKILTNPDGTPIFENGMPKFVLDPEDEKKAMKALSQLRTFGLRYAQTVAKTRILKTASGIRQLPIAQPKPFAVKVVGFRDNLTPEERVARAEKEMSAMFGPSTKVDETMGLSHDEFETIREFDTDFTEDIERELVASAEDVEERVDHDLVRVEGMDPAVKHVGPEEDWDLSDEALSPPPRQQRSRRQS